VGAVQSALSVGGCGREICVLASCSLQFAKAVSAADAAAARDEQLDRCTTGRLYPSRRSTFDKFESLADSFAAGAPPPKHVCTVVTPPAHAAQTSARAFSGPAGGKQSKYVGQKSPQAQSQRLRLRHKISAWASSGPTAERHAAACMMRWCASPLRGPPRYRTVNRSIFLLGLGAVFLKGYCGEDATQSLPGHRHFILT
jgi:hypothetical protein